MTTFQEKSFEAVYGSFLKITNTLIEEDHDPLMLAAVLCTISLSIYRTMLSDTDYDLMIDAVKEFKDEVAVLSPKARLH